MEIIVNADEYACEKQKTLATLLNKKNDVQPLVGIMFEVFSKSPLMVETLEMDIRLNLAKDLRVEVYTRIGHYYDGVGNASAWERVASSSFVPLPLGAGAIIPVKDFLPISMETSERRSFYVTMNGPYIDHNGASSKKEVSTQYSGEDIDLFAGAGFRDDGFPDTVDEDLDPQFAGVIYYHRQLKCDVTMTKTTVEFRFLLSDTVKLSTADLLREIAACVDSTFDVVSQNDTVLQEFAERYFLERQTPSVAVKAAYNDNCSGTGRTCPDFYIRVLSDFTHSDEISSDQVVYQVTQQSSQLAEEIQLLVGSAVKSIGFKSVAASFQIDLVGLAQHKLMNDVQLRYVEQATKRFLQTSLEDTSSMAVLSVALDGETIREQTLSQQNPGLRSLQDVEATSDQGSIQIYGTILGVQLTTMPQNTYRDAIFKTFHDHKDDYVQTLKLDGLRPSEINDVGGLDYFESLTTIGGNIRVGDEKPMSLSLDSDTQTNQGFNKIYWSIIVLAGGLVVVVIIFLCKRRKKNSDEQPKNQNKEPKNAGKCRFIPNMKKQNKSQVRYSDVAKMSLEAKMRNWEMSIDGSVTDIGSIDE